MTVKYIKDFEVTKVLLNIILSEVNEFQSNYRSLVAATLAAQSTGDSSLDFLAKCRKLI